MRSRRDVVLFDSREWVCVNVQSPLGAVKLARRLPLTARRDPPAREQPVRLNRLPGWNSRPG
jgi:hypothetical protein